MGTPDTSLPSAIFKGASSSSYSVVSNISRKRTFSPLALGTSTPIVPFPGIGARILILAERIASEILSAREVILLTFVPRAGSNSYIVITGPLLILTTFASTPNSSNVPSNIVAFCFRSSSFALEPLLEGSAKSSTSGMLYSRASSSSSPPPEIGVTRDVFLDDFFIFFGLTTLGLIQIFSA